MRISLEGTWSIKAGEQAGTIQLPGILQAQGYGEEITRETFWVSGLHDPFWYEREEYQYGQEQGVSIPFLAQPSRHFLGEAWYERIIQIPEGETENIWLFLELARWKSSVWVDGVFKGSDCSLCTPHEICLGSLEPGEHKLTICMDNRNQYPYRPDAHGVSDALGATWNGMAGELLLWTESERKKRWDEKQAYAKGHPRTAEVRDGCFYIDGHREYFRGTHFGGDYPLTGYPSTDREFWDKIMNTVKAWGLNFIRCHSCCPPEAAFAAADEAGVYIQPECGMWNVFQDGISMLSILQEETRRILRHFGHHPSFVLFSPSNEPGGNWYGSLKEWVKETRSYDESLGYGGRRLYTAQSGWFYDVPPKEVTGTDYLYFHRSGYGPILGGNIRNHEGWKGKDYRSSLEGSRLPVICHEMGQWCAYPDFGVMEKFTGYLQPGNYQVFREHAKAHGILERNEEFVRCSGQTQVMMYKEEIEANFRTPQLYGFELLDLHDYLGQGTALVGVLDPFWEEKGYIRPEKFREFCKETVILARIPSYVYRSGDQAEILVEVSHFGKETLEDQTLVWELSGENIQSGWLEHRTIKVGETTTVGTIHLDFSRQKRHEERTLTIFMGEVKNSWNLYVYAREAISDREKSEKSKETVLYTREWKDAREALEKGKAVVYAPWLSDLDFDCPPLSIRPVFWNSQMGPGWCRSLGISVEADHPALAGFPGGEAGGWQWENILSKARGFLMDQMPEGMKPIVTAIDDWNRNLPLGLILEGRVGKGRLLMVTTSLEDSFEENPAAWSLKESLLAYAASEQFCPDTPLTADMIEAHLFSNKRMEQWGAVYLPEPEAKTDNLLALSDVNPNTSVRMEKQEYPISLEIRLKQKVPAEGLVLVPDQKDRMHEGCVKDYVIHISEQGEWKEICRGQLASSFMSQKICFPESVCCSHIRFTALSGYGMEEHMEWEERCDGWYPVQKTRNALIQIAGLHILAEGMIPGDDQCYWNQKRKSSTKEIEE